MHVISFLGFVLLHREYLPFLAMLCKEPVGPLDEPLLRREEYPDMPSGFWEQSAATCFKSAREVIRLLRLVHQLNAMPETPIVAFTIFVAGFCGESPEQVHQV